MFMRRYEISLSEIKFSFLILILKNVCFSRAANGWEDLVFPFPTTKKLVTEKLYQDFLKI